MHTGKFVWIETLFQLLHRHLLQKFSFLGVNGNVIVFRLEVGYFLGLDDFDLFMENKPISNLYKVGLLYL